MQCTHSRYLLDIWWAGIGTKLSPEAMHQRRLEFHALPTWFKTSEKIHALHSEAEVMIAIGTQLYAKYQLTVKERGRFDFFLLLIHHEVH